MMLYWLLINTTFQFSFNLGISLSLHINPGYIWRDHHSKIVPNFFCKIQQVHKKKTELGIGQTSIVPHRYKLIDYLPSMFFYKFLVQSKKPEAVSSLATLIYPFDKYCWYLLIASILATFIALLSIQKCWMVASGERPSNIWIFEGHWKF